MDNNIILNRRSVRTFNEKAIDIDSLNKIKEYIKSFKNPFTDSNNIFFDIYSKEEYDLNSKVIKNEHYYLIGKIKKVNNYEISFGYELENILLFARTLNIDSVILASTFEKENFLKAINLSSDEIMPVVCPLGYKSDNLSLKEKALRRFCNSDNRKDFSEFVFDMYYNPYNLSNEEKTIFELIRKSPSARNIQPIKIFVENNYYHFYIEHTKGFKNELGDVQKIDLGILLSHAYFALSNYYKNIEFIKLDNFKDISDNISYEISIKFE